MSCERPCYTQPRFDYPGMACFLENNMNYADTGMRVVVMMKDKYNPGAYRYVEKPVMYFIPTDPTNSSTVLAYVAPGHDNHYNYMYLLSRRMNNGYNTFAGDHFTMGLRNGDQFDLHYTSYDYTAKSRPVYLYYNLLVDSNTSPSDITSVVCSTKINNKYKAYDDTLNERCYFFDNLMKYVHNSTHCEKQFHSQFKTHTYSTGSMYGGKKRKSKNNQKGGSEQKHIKSMNIDNIEEPFKEIIKILEDKVGQIPNLQSIEMHIIKDNKGILTYSMDSSNIESVQVSANGLEEQTGDFTTYYSLPFDFSSHEFISIEELVQSIDNTVNVKSNKMRFPLKNLVLCDNRLDYGTIIEMTKKPIFSVKDCRNVRFNSTVVSRPMIEVSTGGKNKKNDTTKKSKSSKSSKPISPLKFA